MENEHERENEEKNIETVIIREYAKIEGSLKRIITAQGRTGLLTDYVILSAVQSIDDDGAMLTNTGWHTNPANGIPYHRMIGLLEYNRALMIQEAIAAEEL